MVLMAARSLTFGDMQACLAEANTDKAAEWLVIGFVGWFFCCRHQGISFRFGERKQKKDLCIQAVQFYHPVLESVTVRQFKAKKPDEVIGSGKMIVFFCRLMLADADT